MKIIRLRKAALGAAVLIAGAAGAAGPGVPAGATAHPPAAAPRVAGHQPAAAPVLVDCTNQWRRRPHRFVLTCADGNDFLRRLQWARWDTTALGTGVERINDCIPDCAQGTFIRHPVAVVLWRVRVIPGTSQLHYTRLTTVFTGKRPVVDGRKIISRTWKLWSHI